MITAPGIRQHLADSGYSLHREHDGTGYMWIYDTAAQPLIDGYTLEQAVGQQKRLVDAVEQDQLARSIALFYPGVELTALETDSWRPKYAEAVMWQAWSSGDQTAPEPVTSVLDLEVSTVVTKPDLVTKVIAKGNALNERWHLIKVTAQTIKAALSEAADFDEITAVDINAGWPV